MVSAVFSFIYSTLAPEILKKKKKKIRYVEDLTFEILAQTTQKFEVKILFFGDYEVSGTTNLFFKSHRNGSNANETKTDTN